MRNDHAIAISRLRKRYPNFDLGPLDLVVPRGSIFGFVGPNGAGKSTTIDLLFGMGRCESGTIHILGLDAEKEEAVIKKRAAYVSPELEYGSWGTIGKALRFMRGFYPNTWDDAYCSELLEAFQLGTKDKIPTLSFGSRTKLALVIALARRPELLVLDEPTTGLDAIAKQALFTKLLDFVEDASRTILISSHNLTDLERFADHVAIINDGILLYAGQMDAVIDPFCIADYTLAEGDSFTPTAGLTLIHQDGNRVRALVDRKQGTLEALAATGASDVSQNSVNLEELFVSLLKK